MNLKSRVAIVTGGTRGIGRAIAQALLRQEANVVIAARHDQEIAQAVDALKSAGLGQVAGTPCDVRKFSEVLLLMEFTQQRFGGLDILINNAGVGLFAPVAELTPEAWGQVIDTNLTGVYNTCHLAIPCMRRRSGGHIVNIGSLAGKNAFAGGAAYNASKFGLIGFSEALMLENRYYDIRVTCLMPGSVNTEFGGDSVGGAEKSWQLTPEDVAQSVIHVLSSDSRAMISQLEIRPAKPPKK
ncbi:MAG: SDR family oxidoreductase [Acidobacteria bacterium]|nr:SDR family oxidoreductase [Acidobacteriota bacterium]MBI3657553.1 SDR family oxidoreductase [Acidobacteriota bacterium]